MADGLSLPFLPQLQLGMPPPGGGIPPRLYNSRFHVYPLARHIFPLSPDFPPGSIAFIGLGKRIVPFPWCEDQARAAVEVFDRPEDIDWDAERRLVQLRYAELWEKVAGQELALARIWHLMPDLEQFDYRNELRRFAGHPEGDVQQWLVQTYKSREVLREEWRDVVRCGEEAEYLGADTEAGWVRILEKLKQRAETRLPSVNTAASPPL